jgi:hypothetical protein
MGRVPVGDVHTPDGGVVIAFVQAQVLRILGLGLRTFDHDGIYGGGQELRIGDVRPGDDHGQRAAVLLDQQAPLHAVPPTNFRVKFTNPESRARIAALDEQFKATLTPAQMTMYLEVSTEDFNEAMDDFYEMIGELQRHLPMLAPAISCVAFHVCEAAPTDRGTC